MDDKLHAALNDAIAIAESYKRNRAQLFQALDRAGFPSAWLTGWDAKCDRILEARQELKVGRAN